MNTRPTLLFHCQHAMGMGHLIRSFALAEAFAEKFRVVLLNGGPMPEGVQRPASVECVDLPALGLETDGSLVSRDENYSISTARTMRRELILDTLRVVKPQVLLIELFPFGRKKFAGELLPLLEAARRLGPHRPLTLCSVRDILVGERKDQFAHEARAGLMVNHYFDAVLVHADPKFIRLEETFASKEPLRAPVFYTGFVFADKSAGRPRSAARSQSSRILVSAGGGLVGGTLFRMAIEAHALLQEPERVQMKIVAGPFLPEEEWQFLQNTTRGWEGIELLRSVPDLSAEMRAATASISQCGYNTTMDLLHAGVPGLVVPFAIAGEDEQMNRARRLEQAGVVRVLDPRQANGAVLAEEIKKLLEFQPKKAAFDLNGARYSAQLVEKLLRERTTGAKSNGKLRSNAGAWLDTLRRVLDESPDKVLFFFRDDDAGWEDKRLLQLLSLFEHLALPIDLAVIPKAITPAFAKKLRARVEAAPERVGVHQHGYAHANHEIEGRNYEFGPSRNFEEQFCDLSVGQQMMEELFGDLVAPIFTPPWNRCTEVTGQCLVELGFKILSRDATAKPLGISKLQELCISIDWLAKRKGVRLTREEIVAGLAEAARQARPVGIMFHHAVMDDEEQAAASELLFLLATHGNAKCRSMQYVAKKMVAKQLGDLPNQTQNKILKVLPTD